MSDQSIGLISAIPSHPWTKQLCQVKNIFIITFLLLQTAALVLQVCDFLFVLGGVLSCDYDDQHNISPEISVATDV
jgi:hypothetical protein